MEYLVTTTVLKAGLIDLDATFLIQLGLFLILYVILWAAFFGPYTKFIRRRDEATEGMKARAVELLRESRKIEKELDERLTAARIEAMQLRRQLAEEGKKLRDEIVTREKARMKEELDKQLGELETSKNSFLTGIDAVTVEMAGLIENQLRAAEGSAAAKESE